MLAKHPKAGDLPLVFRQTIADWWKKPTCLLFEHLKCCITAYHAIAIPSNPAYSSLKGSSQMSLCSFLSPRKKATRMLYKELLGEEWWVSASVVGVIYAWWPGGVVHSWSSAVSNLISLFFGTVLHACSGLWGRRLGLKPRWQHATVSGLVILLLWHTFAAIKEASHWPDNKHFLLLTGYTLTDWQVWQGLWVFNWSKSMGRISIYIYVYLLVYTCYIYAQLPCQVHTCYWGH